jgi:hypothetical protein
MPQGKPSIRSKIEAKYGSLWTLLRKHCKGCKTKEEGAKALNSALKDPGMHIQPPVLLSTIKKALDNGEIKEGDFFAEWAEKNKSGKKGKVSIRSKIEKKHGSLWDLLRKHCKGCKTKEEGADALDSFLNDSELSMSAQVLSNTIEKGIESGEIKKDEFFVAWTIRKRRGRKPQGESEKQEEIVQKNVVVKCRCQNCGHEVRVAHPENEVRKIKSIGINGIRCSSCGLWATYHCEYNMDGKTIQEFNKDWQSRNTGLKQSRRNLEAIAV